MVNEKSLQVTKEVFIEKIQNYPKLSLLFKDIHHEFFSDITRLLSVKYSRHWFYNFEKHLIESQKYLKVTPPLVALTRLRDSRGKKTLMGYDSVSQKSYIAKNITINKNSKFLPIKHSEYIKRKQKLNAAEKILRFNYYLPSVEKLRVDKKMNNNATINGKSANEKYILFSLQLTKEDFLLSRYSEIFDQKQIDILRLRLKSKLYKVIDLIAFQLHNYISKAATNHNKGKQLRINYNDLISLTNKLVDWRINLDIKASGVTLKECEYVNYFSNNKRIFNSIDQDFNQLNIG